MALRQDFISLAARYMLRILLFTLVLFIARPSFCDTGGWAATYGGRYSDCAGSIQQTNDRGYIVAGSTRSFGSGSADIWILKLRSDGSVEWQKSYGGDGYDNAYSIQQTKDGGYIVAGLTKSFGTGEDDICVLKLKADGAVDWQKTYGGDRYDEAHSVQQTKDGGYIVAGWTDSFGAGPGDRDAWILKLRSDGTVEWQKTYREDEGAKEEYALSIHETRDGGYIVGGGTESLGATLDSDAWVLKLTQDGAVDWQKTYGGISVYAANSIHETRDGGYIVAGARGSLGAAEGFDAWVLKLTQDGAVDWQKTYGGIGDDSAFSIHETGKGGYIVACGTESFGAGECDFWVLKLGPEGSVEWQKSYGGDDWEWPNSIHETDDGGYIVAGETKSFGAGEADSLVLKLRPDGYIDSSCDFIRETNISGEDNNAAVKSPRVIPLDSRANPQSSTLQSQVTNVSANILCPRAAPGED
ncbi:MAG TPA: hypothetical protein ACFYD2_04680 [Candidatus Avalokitesvara rifleensis]|uniref:hypothetical protein n=1 Tax=Candidatus Avalokitesvara rifleensis TaxID=3367620 RepID=UPI0027131569|nr:hypothetical protein [Candidatus Brocadiales bacterium]